MKQCPHCLATFEDTMKQCPQDNCALQPASAIDPLLGTCLADRYKIISVLGSGGMGTVYKAQHLAMERLVAVKILHAHLASRANALKRFHEEAKTIAQLHHHNIITLYDFGISANSQPFLVMDYIDGFSLKKFMDEIGAIPLEHIMPILKQVVDGLAYAHSANVVHRDLKPENIMLTKSEQGHYKVTLVDFGLAALAAENGVAPAAAKGKGLLGSPYYMSPEQCLSNASVDNRCDIYSLAVVLYEALAGRLPFEKKSGIAMLESHVYKQPIPFNLSQPHLKVCTELARVFNQALAKEPENRYPTINEFAIDMADALKRDAVKCRAIKHRSLAAKQTMTSTRSPTDEDSITDATLDASLFDLQFQTGRQFLSRQAEIEAALFNPEQEWQTKQTSNNDTNSQELEKKQCLYCSAMMPVGIQFCLTCQRKIRERPNKMSQTYSCIIAAPFDVLDKDRDAEQIEMARSNIRSLRSSNLNTTMAKIQRSLIYAITVMLLLSFLMICRSYLDMTKSAKYLTHFVGSGKFTSIGSYMSSKNR